MKNPHDVRIVVTGIGTINPIGNNVEEFWQNLISGKSGIRLAKNVDLSDYSVKIAGEIDLPDLTPYFKPKRMSKKLDRYIVLGHVAGCEAIEDTGIDIDAAPTRYGSLIGTGGAGVIAHYQNVNRIAENGMASVSPYYTISAIPNTGTAFLAQQRNLQGPSFAMASACASSLHAIGVAATLIKMGMADAIFAGGADAAANESGIASFGKIFALSCRNDSPETASRPFDKDRDGFVLSEGAGVLCLEELEHARARGARIYAELLGFGLSCDAHDMVAPPPQGDGASRAMQMALDAAELNPEHIDLVNCHATSTTIGDASESLAINRTFGDYAAKVPTHSTKSMVGHLLGGAGSLAAIAAILALKKGVIHPTTNVFDQDPEINLNVIKKTTTNGKINHVLCNAFGFGGQNASIILSKFKG